MHTVHIRVNDAATGKPTACRVRFTDAEGRYYAPLGRLTEFAAEDYEDVGGNLQIGDKKYAYIDGACEIRLPVGFLTVEISKGLEYRPLHEEVRLGVGKLALRFNLERWVALAAEGWYSGDAAAFALPPHAAALEGAAEGVAVVNILAEEKLLYGYDLNTGGGRYNRAVPNIIAFSGQEPAVARRDCMVAVNTTNQAPVLGRLVLLNCHRPVFPLTVAGGSGEERFYDWTLADWADQCHRKGGLVVGDAFGLCDVDMDGRPFIVGGELLADLILGKVDAINSGWFGGRAEDGVLKDWRAVLNAGFRIPLAAGSWKRSNRHLLGSPRTYARLQPGEDLTYKNWIEAIRAGRTYVSNGPLISFAVNGQGVGAVLDIPASTKNLHIRAEARSLFPVSDLEVVCNGAVVGRAEPSGSPMQAIVEMELPLSGPCWLAACCWGPEDERIQDCVGAHTSPVYVQIDGERLRPDASTSAPLFAWLDRVHKWVMQEAKCRQESDRQGPPAIFEAARQELLRRQIG